PPAPNSAFPAKAPDPSDEPPPDFPARSLSHALVAVGLAKADNTWPHRFAEQLQAVEDQARADRLGLWSRQTELTPPSASSTQSPIPDRDSAAPPR
ncbi:MAG: thermonuclease family protein, partial [Planctomycetota bacterium]